MPNKTPNMGGRRWRPNRYLISTPYKGSAGGDAILDRVDWKSSDAGSTVLDRNYEYRLVWDSEHELWRADVRLHAEGG